MKGIKYKECHKREASETLDVNIITFGISVLLLFVNGSSIWTGSLAKHGFGSVAVGVVPGSHDQLMVVVQSHFTNLWLLLKRLVFFRSKVVVWVEFFIFSPLCQENFFDLLGILILHSC
jgi:hypothetical protein